MSIAKFTTTETSVEISGFGADVTLDGADKKKSSPVVEPAEDSASVLTRADSSDLDGWDPVYTAPQPVTHELVKGTLVEIAPPEPPEPPCRALVDEVARYRAEAQAEREHVARVVSIKERIREHRLEAAKLCDEMGLHEAARRMRRAVGVSGEAA